MKLRFVLIMTIIAALNIVTAYAGGEQPATVEKSFMPGVENFSRIDGNTGFAGGQVGFGGATQPSAMAELGNKGFVTVINLRAATEDGADVEGSRTAAGAAGLHYINLPFNPKNADPAVIDEVLSAVADPDNQPVYIHCGSATRVAALWMIGRVLNDGWDMDQASTEARAIAKKPDEAVGFATAYINSVQGK